MYEHVEMHLPSGEVNRDERTVRNVHYELSLDVAGASGTALVKEAEMPGSLSALH